MSQVITIPQSGPYVDPNTQDNTLSKVNNWKMFMWLFLAQDAMTFFCMFAAYLALRIGTPKLLWPEPSDYLGINLTAVMTFVLICSSVTMVQAVSAVQRNDGAGLRKWLAFTILGGMFFLSCQVYEYTHLFASGMHMSRHLFDGTFFILTGFHGLHVLSGVVYLISILAKSGRYNAKNYAQVEVVGLYWHFVDLVWIILFTLVYLI